MALTDSERVHIKSVSLQLTTSLGLTIVYIYIYIYIYVCTHTNICTHYINMTCNYTI